MAYRDPHERSPSALAEGAIAAFVVGVTVGLGILWYGTSGHQQTATVQTGPTTTGQGFPDTLDNAGKTGETKERRAIQDAPATKEAKPPLSESNVPPAGKK